MSDNPRTNKLLNIEDTILNAESNITLYFLENELPIENFWLPRWDWNTLHIEFTINLTNICTLAFNLFKYFLTFFLPNRTVILYKEEVRTFKFYDLYTFSAKQLKVKKRRMLLLNMKKTLNNFWAWIRTHTIFYIPKIKQTVSHYFIKLQNLLPIFSTYGKILNIKDEIKTIEDLEIKLNKQLDQSYARIVRKYNWLKHQHALKKAHDLRFNERNYNKQSDEYMRFLIKQNDQLTQLSKIRSRDYTLQQQLMIRSKNLTNDLPKKLLHLFHNFKSKILRATTMIFKDIKFQFLKRFYEKDKLEGFVIEPDNEIQTYNELETIANKLNLKRAIPYAIKAITKRYLPYPQYKKLEKKFRSNRRALFKKIRKVLILRESYKLPLLNFLSNIKKAYIKFTGDFALRYDLFIAAAAKAVVPIQKTTPQIFEYNVSKFIPVCIQLVARGTKIPEELKHTENVQIRNYSKINLLELKRIL